MSDWKRTTLEVSIEKLSADLGTAIAGHIERYHLSAILEGALMCVETRSEKIKKSLFSGSEVVRTGVVATSRWLVWASDGTKTGMGVLSAQLRDVTVEDYSQTHFFKLIPDFGVQVSGKFTDVSENGSAFIGLEENDSGRKFKDFLIQAVQDAKR